MDKAPVDFFLSEGPLTPADASVAIIILDDRRYLMQLRDQRRGVFYPGHWGLFGGAIEPGETPEAALYRELLEELDYRPLAVSYFTRFSFDFRCCGSPPVERYYYEVKVAISKVQTMTLGEGSALRAFDAEELLAGSRVTPYDAFAIWMHLTQAR